MGTSIVRTDEPPLEGGVLVPGGAPTPAPLRLLRPIASPAAVIEAQEAARALVAEALHKDRDYGVIPGTDKPTLLKPGAERVALAFGCYYGEPRIIEREVDHDRVVQWNKVKWVTVGGQKPANWEELKAAGKGRNKKFGDKWVWQERQSEEGTSIGLYRYVLEVPVIERATGRVVGTGIGACSTLETKYIDRPRDCENTVLKMAHKRGIVSAALVTFGLSDQFTQDVEDLPHLADAAPAPDAPPEPPPAPEPPLTRDSEVTWGKMKGTKIRDLPVDYIEWAIEPGRKFGARTLDWQAVMRAELDARDDARLAATMPPGGKVADLFEQGQARGGDEALAAAGAKILAADGEEVDDDLPF